MEQIDAIRYNLERFTDESTKNLHKQRLDQKLEEGNYDDIEELYEYIITCLLYTSPFPQPIFTKNNKSRVLYKSWLYAKNYLILFEFRALSFAIEKNYRWTHTHTFRKITFLHILRVVQLSLIHIQMCIRDRFKYLPLTIISLFLLLLKNCLMKKEKDNIPIGNYVIIKHCFIYLHTKMLVQTSWYLLSVSYTHLDVYKRQR